MLGAVTTRQQMALLWLFTVSLFSSAFLLFLVEPMLGKLLLPVAGGTPAVWTTAVVFFQAVLLLGYAYAHLLTSRLGRRGQALAHLVVLAVAAAALPIQLPGWSARLLGWQPALAVLATLAVAAGLPFFALSATSPLLQRWFSQTGHPQAPDPYFLYRASNLGSLLSLLLYPVAIETHLGLRAQGRWWAAGYGLLVVLMLGTGFGAARRSPDAEIAVREAAAEPVSWRRRLTWIALAAVPAVWMLAVTSYLTTTVLPMPLLWVIPLAIYLGSFSVVFSPRNPLTPERLTPLLPYLLLLMLGLLLFPLTTNLLWLVATLHLVAFAAGALVLHGRLAADRPGPRRLTEFYFWMSAGGVLGGAAAALVAPFVLASYLEYPLALAACAALLVARKRSEGRQRQLDWALPAGLAGLTLALGILFGPGGRVGLAAWAGMAVVYGLPAVACFSFSHRPLRFGLGLAAITVVATTPFFALEPQLFSGRDFFGVVRVQVDRQSGRHEVLSGNVIHGSENWDAARRDQPETYYARSGPVGDVLDGPGLDGARVAVIGLGAGSVACYARAGQQWTFYEIDPLMVRVAEDPTLFGFLDDCLPGARVVLGDGRLEIARAPEHSYDLILVDAFGSDNVPAHLLTVEALRLYESKLKPGGRILVNVSNNFVNLRPVFAAGAREVGLGCYGRVDTELTAQDVADGKTISSWVLLQSGGSAPSSLWHPVPAEASVPAWSDDFSNLLSVVRLVTR